MEAMCKSVRRESADAKHSKDTISSAHTTPDFLIIKKLILLFEKFED